MLGAGDDAECSRQENLAGLDLGANKGPWLGLSVSVETLDRGRPSAREVERGLARGGREGRKGGDFVAVL